MKYILICLVFVFSLISFSYSESAKSDTFQKGLQQFLGKDIKGAITTLSSIPKADPKYDKAQTKIKEWQGILDKQDKLVKLMVSVKYEIVAEKSQDPYGYGERKDIGILVSKDITDDELEALGLVLKDKYASVKFIGIDICDDKEVAINFTKGSSFQTKLSDSEFNTMYKHLRAHYGKDKVQHFFSLWKDGKDGKMWKY